MQDFNEQDLFQDEPSPRTATLPKGAIAWIAGGICAALVLPSLIAGMPDAAANKQKVRTDLDRVSRMQIDSVTQQELARIAEQRYVNGCRFVVSSLDPAQAVALGEQVNVVDLATGTFLPAGTVVCDAIGNTAVLELRDLDGDGMANPVTSSLAFTGNRRVVETAMQQAGFTANNPSLVRN